MRVTNAQSLLAVMFQKSFGKFKLATVCYGHGTGSILLKSAITSNWSVARKDSSSSLVGL